MIRSRQEGFSLPEVMIILVILAILIAASQIPIANDLQLRQRASLHSGVRDLANWIELVRT
jgi:prepilin-type N-terminal cleavage/methylation domain-containing protein